MDKEYKAFSLYTIAYFMCEGVEIKRIEKVDDKVVFIFDYNDKLQSVLEKKRSDEWFQNFVLSYQSCRQMMINKRGNRKEDKNGY